MLEITPRRNATPQAPTGGRPQSGRLLLALVLLVVALAVILVKDRDFWFGSDQAAVEMDSVGTSATPAATVTPSSHPAPVVAHSVKRQAPASTVVAEQKPAEPPVVARTVLAPLDVEVVAGDRHSKIHPGSNSTKLEITNPAASAEKTEQELPVATSAADREQIADASQPIYPPLAQHMNVQGSVVLQALIGTDGTIQNLRVLKGPAILATAAQQAVREWHFKPIVQNGQAVESKATITVNFSIKVADNSPKTTLAEMRVSDNLVITR